MATDDPIDRYLTELRSQVADWHRDPDDVVAEAADHLHERTDALMHAGRPQAAAVEQAIAEYGDSADVAAAHLRASRHPAIPTTGTRQAGVAAIVAGSLWLTLVALALFVHTDVWILWLGLATLFHATIALSLLAYIGLWTRHGGLGRLAVAAAVPAVVAAPFVMFAWPIPIWLVLLGLATLLVGIALVRQDVAPRLPALAMTAGMALAGLSTLAAEVAVSDTSDDFAFLASRLWVAGILTGLTVFGLGLIGVGQWMRSESPVAVPPLPAPSTH